MTRSLSKIAAMLGLGLGLALLVQAAPPRFSDWGAWNRGAANNGTAQVAATQTDGAASLSSDGDNSQAPSSEVEQVEAQLISPALIKPQKSPEPARDPRARRRDAQDKQEKSDAGFSFLSMFQKREPIVPDERTVKPAAALITTREHHKDKVELLGMGETRYFGPSVNEARWRVDGNRTQCTLRQDLPFYGYVAFRQGTRKGLRFELHVKRAPAGLTLARFRSQPPHWKHYAQDKDLGVIALTNNEQALQAEVAWARRLIAELSEGMQPTLRYWDATDGTEEVQVEVSPLHFRRGLQAFQSCLNQLVQIDVAAMENTVVHFAFDSAELQSAALSKLDKLALMLNNDAQVSRVVIEGHTDSRGFRRYNTKLATRRAQSVRQYLLDKGIPKEKLRIKVRAFGETKPDASNRTAQGRAENRRVEITVHRDADRA